MRRRHLLGSVVTGAVVGTAGCASLEGLSSSDASPECSSPTFTRAYVQRQVECADDIHTSTSVWANVDAGNCSQSVGVVAEGDGFRAQTDGLVSIDPAGRGRVQLEYDGWPDRGDAVTFSLLDKSGTTVDEMTAELEDYRYRPMSFDIVTHLDRNDTLAVGEELAIQFDVASRGGQGSFRATLGVDGETKDAVRKSLAAVGDCVRESPLKSVELTTVFDTPGEYTVYVDVEPVEAPGSSERGYVGEIPVKPNDDT